MMRPNKFIPLLSSAPQRRACGEQVLKKVTQRKRHILSAQFLGHKVPSIQPHLPQIIENITETQFLEAPADSRALSLPLEPI